MFIHQIKVLNILNVVYTLRIFLLKMQFHNSNLFGSCIIHILYTGVLKLKKNISGSKSLRFPDFVTTAQDGGKVVILTHRPPHFC